MNNIKRIITILLISFMVTMLTACGSFTNKATSNIDAYMNNIKKLNSDNYFDFLTSNLENPYEDKGLVLDQMQSGEMEYFVKCLSMIKYEITNIDETNKVAEVNVTYVDSTEYITNLFAQIMAYAFSEDYDEEGLNQIYIDVMNDIDEYSFVDETVYFGLNDDATIATVSNNVFDVVTAGLYKIMLGGSSESGDDSAKYSEEELLENIVVDSKVLDENTIFVTFTNNNEVPIYPIANFVFVDPDGGEIISQANMEVLPAGATNYTYAYNEMSDENDSFEIELSVEYYNPEDIEFFDESLIPYEIKQEDDMVSIFFTNNTDEIINICGGYIAYDENDNMMSVNDISIYDLNPGQSDSAWFYLNSEYDESTDTWTVIPYGRIEIYPIAHTQATSIWAS